MSGIKRFLQEGALLIIAVVRPGAQSVRENTGLAVLSVVLAFGMWILVTNAQNPTGTQVLPVDIEVRAVNVPSDVAVDGDLAPVRVRIRAEQNLFDTLTAADFEATVDLNGLTVGTYTVQVKVQALTGGVRVEEVLPKQIDVKLVELSSKSVPVEVEVKGEPPPNYTMGVAQAKDRSAQVSGPQEKTSLVTKVVASLDVSARTQPVDQAVRLEPRDSRGLLVVGVTVDPAITKVTLDIEQKVFSTVLIVSPDVTGTPAAGYSIAGVSVSPATVTVSGPQGFIQSAASSIKTKPVSVDGKKEDVVKSVSLVDLPDGVSVTGGNSVTVTVSIVATTGEMRFGVPITATNVPSDLTISGVLPSAEIIIDGPLPALLELTPGDLSATVDLKDSSTGTNSVTVKVTVPSGLDVRAIAPHEIQVTLGKKAP